ncbi:hypothetical protein ACDY96_08310 [Rhizobium mongolense]|uniref:hypothetical protein n=1 Tax=Rhizobium TaxID=379 RepID=UPI0024B2272A|nr:hypothetical protein [Rhizobium sp. CC1099]WFU88869.1 hypothetical protein QA644_07385 [Rhizobium sp. CC1099]
MKTAFLFMDESKAQSGARGKLRVTKLTGLLVPSESHRAFRTAYYNALVRVQPAQHATVPALPEVHAMTLFSALPNVSDSDRIGFANELVDILLNLEIAVLNSGYLTNSMTYARSENQIVGLCFLNFLWALHTTLDEAIIWPVMETDNTREQDMHFAGSLQNVEHLVSQAPRLSGSVSINFKNLGEVLYVTKRSAFGATADVIGYILHKRWLRQQGVNLSVFAGALADIAERLHPVLVADEIIRMKVA